MLHESLIWLDLAGSLHQNMGQSHTVTHHQFGARAAEPLLLNHGDGDTTQFFASFSSFLPLIPPGPDNVHMLDVNGTYAASDVADWRSGRLVGRRYPKQYNVASTTNIAVIFHAGAGRSTELPAREWDKKPYKILGRQKVADNWSLVTGDFLHEPPPQWRVSWGNYQTLIKNCKLCIEWTNGDTMKENVHKTVRTS